MTPVLQACWAAAVTLALYAFYCFWEANRADLVDGFRHLAPGRPDSGGPSYRSRAWWAAAAAVLLTFACLASAL
ncbi:MAG TPA: hypothetical protein VH764_17715 [Gemmatimonadales bacterium]|jgi:hypothetical protein